MDKKAIEILNNQIRQDWIENPLQTIPDMVDKYKCSRDKIKNIQAALEQKKLIPPYKEIIAKISETNPDVLKKSNIAINSSFDIDIIERKCKAKVKDIQDKYDNLLNKYEELDERYDALLLVNDQSSPSNIIAPKESLRAGASLVAWSDWHIEKRIDAHTVNGLNSFDLSIAKERSELCATNTVKLINRDSKDFDNHTTVLFLLGDFIEGYLHEHNEATNYLTPVEAIMYVKELIANGINHLIKNAKTNKIVVCCVTGNHSRQTKKMNSSIDHRTNFEYMLYSALYKQFSDKVEFYTPYSDIGYIEILGKTIRYWHGWQICYSGGIGGVTIPLTKFVQRQDQVRYADFNIFGHFHQLSKPIKNGMLNGSLCGYDTYAQTIGASAEKAQQGYQLLDEKYGFTSFTPIICE